MASGGGSGRRKQRVERPEEMINKHVVLHAYITMAVTGIGYLALGWSTVVLLGGFVSSLGGIDFWSVAAISMIQAARVFDDLEDDLLPKFLILMHPHRSGVHRSWRSVIDLGPLLLFYVLRLAIYAVLLLYTYGPIACMMLSSIYLANYRNYDTADGDGSKAKLATALVIFYSLVQCQGAVFSIWTIVDFVGDWIVESVRKQCQFPVEWGRTSVAEYLFDSRAKCGRDPASIKGRNLISYALELLDSESPEGYLSGARMLDAFISQGEDVRPLLLASGPKIQKLIGTLGLRSCSANSTGHIRDLAARIVAHLAADIHLAHFPGATRCISSLLDLPPQDPHDFSPKSCLSVPVSYWAKDSDRVVVSRQLKIIKALMNPSLDRDVGQRRDKKSKNEQGAQQHGDVQQKKPDSSIDDRKAGSCNQLILQGLEILERLACDQHNIRDICSTHGLLPKIMAPLYSETLIEDIKISRPWAEVVNRSFKVVLRLIRAPGWTGRRLRREISGNNQAMSNLEKILESGEENIIESSEADQKLEMRGRAMEIMTELALDLSVNLTRETKENLIKKQLQSFLADTSEEKLKATAGRTLTSLCKSETASEFITKNCNDIVDCLLTEILDAKNNIKYRTTAAEILVNLCSHCTLDEKRVKETFLQKVLEEILTSKREPPTEASQSSISASGDDEENLKNSALEDDEEKQLPKDDGQNKSSDQANEEQTAMMEFQETMLRLTSNQANEEQTAMMEFQETMLRLTLVTYDKLIGVDSFDLVAQESTFVKLKTIVDENCQATPVSLRIVKLCGQIAVSMMRRNKYTEHFKQFKESLSNASKIMSNLESCMLFAGTDGRVNKAVRPLLSNLEKEVTELVGKLEVNNDQ